LGPSEVLHFEMKKKGGVFKREKFSMSLPADSLQDLKQANFSKWYELRQLHQSGKSGGGSNIDFRSKSGGWKLKTSSPSTAPPGATTSSASLSVSGGNFYPEMVCCCGFFWFLRRFERHSQLDSRVGVAFPVSSNATGHVCAASKQEQLGIGRSDHSSEKTIDHSSSNRRSSSQVHLLFKSPPLLMFGLKQRRDRGLVFWISASRSQSSVERDVREQQQQQQQWKQRQDAGSGTVCFEMFVGFVVSCEFRDIPMRELLVLSLSTLLSQTRKTSLSNIRRSM
jgi:hypothetical protein